MAILVSLVFVAYTFILPNMALATPVPDTGQTKCYNNTNEEIPCPQPGEPFYGQDAQYSVNPPSYTKLDANGNPLPDSTSSWAMVRDNVTGLIWENKTDDGSLHDKDISYNWQDAQDVFIASLNANHFGGFSDWRLPTAKELSSIIFRDVYNPSINTNYFPNTLASAYWSSTPDKSDINLAWWVYFYDGCIYHHKTKLEYSNVRAVRGRQLLNNYVENGDGTVTDTNTDLMWQQDGTSQRTWEGALAYCENLTLAGYNDWRLPNINELHSLVDFERYNPSINTTYFITMGSAYWSSTSFTGDLTHASDVDFYYGGIGNGLYNKTTYYYVRAVRGPITTIIKLCSFEAAPKANMVTLEWSTETEIDNAGFNLYRSESENGNYIKINTSLIPAKGSPTQGASYEFIDNNVKNRKTYYYKLEDIDLNGTSTMHGPVSAMPRWIYGQK